MSDDFEELLKGWLVRRGAVDHFALEALAGHVAVLPPRRDRQVGPFAAVAAVVLAVGLAAVALIPHSPSGTSEPSAPVPPDPAAFAGDPRLAQCGATVASALDVFEMTDARDYHRYLPAMLLAPELDVDAPAFVVVFRAMQWFGGGAPLASGQTEAPARSLAPGYRDLCVLVGTDPATVERNAYADVDISGLRAIVGPAEHASPGSDPQPGASSTPDPAPPTTPEPAPAWTADLAGQLQCTGAVADIGGEVSDGVAREVIAAGPDEALAAFLAPPSPYGGLPTRGYTKLHAERDWATYGHIVGGRRKAILVASDLAPGRASGWSVVGLRACDPSEFDPGVPLTYPLTIWTDPSGARISTTVIVSSPGPGHCIWESATFLRVGVTTYVRDPHGLPGLWIVPRFDPAATLPLNARDSGYRSGNGVLWIVPGGDAYLVLAGRVERWPRLDPFVGCT